jgi:hypothetical protein
VIESTSTYHRPIVHALHGEFDAIIITPALAGNAKKKADKYDATLLSYHGLTGGWDTSFLPSGLHQGDSGDDESHECDWSALD